MKNWNIILGLGGVIYGDSITMQRAKEICERLESAGFASTNIVFGIGSYTYNYNTRDNLGLAMKSTFCIVNGKEREIFKDPVTDDGVKKSARGLIAVKKDEESGEYIMLDRQKGPSDDCELREVFKDGNLLIEYSLEEIRWRLGF
jgi:nicotinamide phosphoribosyltransferase